MSLPLISEKKVSGKFLILPVLPAVFFFLHNIGQFMELIFTTGVLILFIAYSVLAYFFFIVGKLLFKLSWAQSLFLSTLIIFCFLFYGSIQDWLFDFKSLRFLSNSILIFILLLTGIVIIFLVVRRRPLNLLLMTRFLMALFLTLIIYEGLRIGYKAAIGKSVNGIVNKSKSRELDNVKIVDKEHPDIYHIIFDGYTNLPVLSEYWGYENDIYPFLASKGFFTFDSATSNYKSTPFSISSIFNLQYLPGTEPFLISTSPNFFLGQRIYKDNALYKFLKKNHYEFSIFTQLEEKKIMLGLGFLGVQDPTYWLRSQTLERLYVNPWTLNKLKGKTDEQPASVIKSMEDFTDYNNKALAHIMNDCKRAPGYQAPFFSFTHIMLPHDPYVHDENGNILKSVEPGGVNMKGYLAQLKYSNKLIKQIVDCLLSDTTRNKIIVIQGDHGYRHFADAPLVKQYAALNAFYFYDKNYTGLNKNMSHVNTYRVIIDRFFDGNLPLLKDSIVIIKKE